MSTRKFHALLQMSDSRYALEVQVVERTGKRIVTVFKDGEVVAVLPED